MCASDPNEGDLRKREREGEGGERGGGRGREGAKEGAREGVAERLGEEKRTGGVKRKKGWRKRGIAEGDTRVEEDNRAIA